MCNTVRPFPQWAQSFTFSSRRRCKCVKRVWPILRRQSRTSTRRSLWNELSHRAKMGFMTWSLLSYSLSHSNCHDIKSDFFKNGFKSWWGNPQVATKSLADAAKLSAFSFPGIPTWLGTQQNFMSCPSRRAPYNLPRTCRVRRFFVGSSEDTASNALWESTKRIAFLILFFSMWSTDSKMP